MGQGTVSPSLQQSWEAKDGLGDTAWATKTPLLFAHLPWQSTQRKAACSPASGMADGRHWKHTTGLTPGWPTHRLRRG